jgi:hypothetical protein
MENTITFTYNPYTYFHSYKNVLENIRKWYSESDIFIYMDSFRDDLDNYKKVSDDYNCNFIVRRDEMYYINGHDPTHINLPKMMEWLNRLKYTCENTNSEWIMLVEDDVVVKRKIQRWPVSDVGTNRNNFRPGGGSIFKREVFLKIYENLGESGLEKIIRQQHTYSWAGDTLIERIFKDANVSNEKWIELAEPGYYDNTNHAVFHGYKDIHKLG